MDVLNWPSSSGVVIIEGLASQHDQLPIKKSKLQLLMALCRILVVHYRAVAAPQAEAKPGCRSHTGNLEIPHPSGTSPNCYLSEDFFINCTDAPKAFLRKSNILVKQ